MPQVRRHGVPTTNRQGDHPVVDYTGFQAYQTGSSTTTLHTNNPTMRLISLFMSWQDIEQTANVFTWPDSLRLSLIDAHGTTGDDYRITLRVSCGIDSPISSRTDLSTPGWMATTAAGFGPVPYIRTLQNERNPTAAQYDIEVLIPIPWDTVYLAYFDRFMRKLSAHLDGDCPASTVTGKHPRRDHVYFIPGAMPTESGTEMAIGYGQVPVTWKESTTGAPPKLATWTDGSGSGTTWTAAHPAAGGTFTLTGDVSQIQQPLAGQYLILKVGGAVGDNGNSGPYGSTTEVVLCSAFNRSTKTGTLAATVGRGWSGTTAVAHNTTTTGSVFYALDTTTSGTTAAHITWNGLTGVFDHVILNRAQWATAPSKDGLPVTENNRRIWMGDAWIASLNTQLAALPSVKAGLAGSSVFRDNMVQANRVLDTLKTTKDYAERLVCMTTHLFVNPAGVVGSRTYAQASPTESAWMLKAASYSHFCGFQTGGLSELANGQDFVDACEDAISSYPTRFIETNVGSRFSGAQYDTVTSGGWPGGRVTMAQYCLTHASNLQARIPSV